MNVVLSERTFSVGRNQYRVDAAGNWSALHFGWFPTGPNPRYQWVAIAKASVPKEVLKAADDGATA